MMNLNMNSHNYYFYFIKFRRDSGVLTSESHWGYYAQEPQAGLCRGDLKIGRDQGPLFINKECPECGPGTFF